MAAPGRKHQTSPKAQWRSAEQCPPRPRYSESGRRRNERFPVRCAETRKETAAAKHPGHCFARGAPWLFLTTSGEIRILDNLFFRGSNIIDQSQLEADNEAAKMFVGKPCGLAKAERWKVEKKNIPREVFLLSRPLHFNASQFY